MASLNYSKTLKRILTLCLSALPCLSFALSSDRQAIAQITADSAEFSQKTGISIYSGHIIAKQGSTQLIADTAEVHRNKLNIIEKIIALGHPATYQTLPDGEKQPIKAMADSIIYYPETHKVLLIGHGDVSQGSNRFSGPHIEYDMLAQTIVSLPAAEGRTTIVINPKQIHS